MKDIEKLLSSMRPVRAPVELRRKILTSLDSGQPETFWQWSLQDWNGWTLRIWGAIPCMMVMLFLFSALQRDESNPAHSFGSASPAVLQEQVKMRKQIFASLTSEMERQADHPKDQDRKPRPGAFLFNPHRDRADCSFVKKT